MLTHLPEIGWRRLIEFFGLRIPNCASAKLQKPSNSVFFLYVQFRWRKNVALQLTSGVWSKYSRWEREDVPSSHTTYLVLREKLLVSWRVISSEMPVWAGYSRGQLVWRIVLRTPEWGGVKTKQQRSQQQRFLRPFLSCFYSSPVSDSLYYASWPLCSSGYSLYESMFL